MVRAIVLISCPDQLGLVHRISKVFADQALNIVENNEHVDRADKRFFMRTEIEGNVDQVSLEKNLRSVLPANAVLNIVLRAIPRIIVFVSKELHCIGDLLIRHEIGHLGAQIQAVISQSEDARSLSERFGLPFHAVPVEKKTRKEHEDELLRVIQTYQFDFMILARYMRILTPEFVEMFPERILNIHHSFLPAFIGRDPYKQAHERGVKIIGATAHFVNGELDEGPIISQSVVPIRHSFTIEQLAELGRDVEKVVLARALKLVFESRVIVHGRRTILFE